MHGNWNTAKIALLVMATAILTWLGASIPVHFRAVSRLVLEEAGRNTRTPQSLSAEYLLAGKTGPLSILWESNLAKPSELDRARVTQLAKANRWQIQSGGPAPYYENFLASLPEGSLPQTPTRVIAPLLATSGVNSALQHLSQSTNGAVSALLKARALTDWRRFMPVATPAGRPLDASILALAMFADADGLRPEFANELTSTIEAARNGDKSAQVTLEDTLLATLSLGRRLDWTEMAEILRRLPGQNALTDLASRAISTPSDFPALYASAILVDDYAPIARFLRDNPGDEGMTSLRTAMNDGSGALKTLFARNRAVYKAPAAIAWLDTPLAWARPTFLTPLTMRHPHALLASKIILLYLAGLALALILSNLCRTAWSLPCELLHKKRHLPLLARLFVAGCFTILIWLILEPNLFRFSTERPARAVFEISLAVAGKHTQTQAMNANSLDQASILSLILFFLIQLAIYVFAVMRINRLRAGDLPAKTKLKLLENDDNLFDLGLYIGLAGTVGSLLMLAMNIIQASLVAAYSSTLFGILFVACVKIVNIRSFRRALILEIQAEETAKKD